MTLDAAQVEVADMALPIHGEKINQTSSIERLAAGAVGSAVLLALLPALPSIGSSA
ncbi:MAG: hypothetical protein ACRYG8_45135 [Janthinobacterium lividum]